MDWFLYDRDLRHERVKDVYELHNFGNINLSQTNLLFNENYVYMQPDSVLLQEHYIKGALMQI